MTGFVDPAFRTVKAGEAAFLVWRIEKLEVRAVPRDQYGTFFDGDAYIVYSGAKQEMHIHFWLGVNSSVDEWTAAAIKAVELDEHLGGSPVQHREVQGHESPRFLSYFKTGIRVLKGGVATGLRHVTQEFTARLFQVKGRRTPVLTQIAPVSWQDFNSGDCFILETLVNIFVWVGGQSNNMEKIQAVKVAMQLRDERPERNIVFVDEDQENDLVQAELADFAAFLPLAQRTIQPAKPDTDIKAETATRSSLKLYRCTDDSGTCKIIQEKEGPLYQSDLNSNDSFIVDHGSLGIWVWVGRRATAEERKLAMSNAQGFVVKKNYPSSTRVTRVIDGAEPTDFKMLFNNWKNPNTSLPLARQYSLSKIAPTVNTKFNASILHETPALAADTQMVDDGTGTVTVWRLHEKQLELVPNQLFGVFFDGDCYLLHYEYSVNSKRNHILYYWLGAHSAQDERGTIAWHTVQKDDELAGAAVQVRVIQGKEPPHFLAIFKGKLTVFNGGYASSFEGVNGHASNTEIPTEFLIQVRGGDDHNTRAVQVERRAASLNSNDVFVLAVPSTTYVWCGKGSTGDERERAKAIAAQWAPNGELVVLSEGKEKSDFWESFPNGQEPYANDERLRDPLLKMPARLFHCSNATGVFKAEEIYDFGQNDLVPDDVMVLDAGTVVFIWIGKGANKEERLSVGQMVHEYLASDPRGRDLDTPLMQVQQGHEPPNFIGFFGIWDPQIWQENDFDTMRGKVEAVRVVVPRTQQNSFPELPKYPLNVLVETDPKKLPEDVNPTLKELHLTEEDFEAAFKMSLEEFNSLPQWRRNNMKKLVRLF